MDTMIGARMSCGPITLYKRPRGPIRHRVKGAPFQPRQWVRVIDIAEVDVFDTVYDDEPGPVAKEYLGHIGCKGLVHALDYSPTIGQVYPDSPMVIVRLLAGGVTDGFWPEELEAA